LTASRPPWFNLSVPPESLSEGETPRILHIDFPPAILRLMEQAFRSRPMRWESAESGVLGLHMALIRDYSLIFLGLKESGLDGLRVAAGLQRSGLRTPLILLMSRRDLDMRREELSRLPNVLACLAKPLDMEQVEKAMEFLRRPPALQPKDRARLLQVLARVERAVHVG